MMQEKELFAKMYAVIYQWPDEEEKHFGFIIHTNYDDSLEAARAVGVSDDGILIYTHSLDPEEIKQNFDGLDCEVIANL